MPLGDHAPPVRGLDHVAVLVPDRRPRVARLVHDHGWILRSDSDRLSLLDPGDGRPKLTLVDADSPTLAEGSAPLSSQLQLGALAAQVAAVLPEGETLPIDHVALTVDDLDTCESLARASGARIHERVSGPHVHSLFVHAAGGLLVEYVMHHTPFGEPVPVPPPGTP